MRGISILWLSALAAILPATVAAHSPICFCFLDEDDTIACEGGFSDGASAEGVAIRVLDDRDRVLIEGAMDENSEYRFARPNGDFHVVFDAGDEHTVTIFEDEIE
jgi:hypothetical protein